MKNRKFMICFLLKRTLNTAAKKITYVRFTIVTLPFASFPQEIAGHRRGRIAHRGTSKSGICENPTNLFIIAFQIS